MVENVATSVYTAVATDPEGSAITYSISGGTDAAAFVLSGNVLTFVTPPNFDLPTDTDGNNVYLVQIRASDGQASSTIDVQITVTNSREGIAVKRVASGFNDPVWVTAIPGDNRLFVVERAGPIYLVDPSNGQKTLFQTLSPNVAGEDGMRAIAAAPDYAVSGRYFVMMTGFNGSLVVAACVRRGTFGSPECNENVVNQPKAQTANTGAFMAYGPDNKLYVATGDGGSPSTAQLDTSNLGKLIRIDNNPDPFAGAAPLYFIATRLSKGFRDPRGGTFFNGQLLVADRGQTARDEVSLASLSGNQNLGWPFKEGTTVVGTTPPAGLTDPVIEYPRAANGGIIGGFVYRGQITSLRNQYIFGDFSGLIFSTPSSRITAGQTLSTQAIERRTADFAPDVGTLNAPVCFGEDRNGELYILDASGGLFMVVNE